MKFLQRLRWQPETTLWMCTVHSIKYAHMLCCHLYAVLMNASSCNYSGLVSWHWGNHMIAPVPVKQPWRIWLNRFQESTITDNINTTKQSTSNYNWYQTTTKHSTTRTMCLTHWGRDQIDAISQTPFSNVFSRMKVNEFRLGFHWSLFLRFELTIFQHWFR